MIHRMSIKKNQISKMEKWGTIIQHEELLAKDFITIVIESSLSIEELWQNYYEKSN